MPQIEAPRTLERRAGIATAVAFSLAAVGAGGARAQEENINPDTAVLLQPDCIPVSEVGTIPGTGPTELLPNGDTVVFPEDPLSPTDPLLTEPDEEDAVAQLSGELPVTDETLPEETTTDNPTTTEAVIEIDPETDPAVVENTENSLILPEDGSKALEEINKKIKQTNKSQLASAINKLYNDPDCAKYLNNFRLPEKRDFFTTKKFLSLYTKPMFSSRQPVSEKALSAPGLTAVLLYAYESENVPPKLKELLYKAADVSNDYSMTGMLPYKNNANERTIRKNTQEYMVSTTATFLDHYRTENAEQ